MKIFGRSATITSIILGTIVLLGSTFQGGHFIEHTVQFGVWLAGDHSRAYMSPTAMSLSHWIGGLFFGTADMSRQMAGGMEILHLLGNVIFLVTIGGMHYFLPVKRVRWAFYVELFHLYEHVMLTSTTIFLGKAAGLSTFFGGALALGGQEFAVGYRVLWHFAIMARRKKVSLDSLLVARFPQISILR